MELLVSIPLLGFFGWVGGLIRLKGGFFRAFAVSSGACRVSGS